MHITIETQDASVVHYAVDHGNFVVLVSFNLELSPRGEEPSEYQLLAECAVTNANANPLEIQLRRLHQFAGLRGLRALDLHRHPFLPCGSVAEITQRYRDVEALVEAELVADGDLGLLVEAMFVSYHLLKPEEPEEQPQPVAKS
jgi:hypothetical protein